jgi:hypothetical protein
MGRRKEEGSREQNMMSRRSWPPHLQSSAVSLVNCSCLSFTVPNAQAGIRNESESTTIAWLQERNVNEFYEES